MSAIHTRFVGRKHPWTSLDIGWQIDDTNGPRDGLTADQRNVRSLFRFLSGGGLRAFAGSVMRDLVDRQQSRFLCLSALLGVMWLIFWFV